MKKLFLAVALVVAFAAPAMAQNFPNPYSQNSPTRTQEIPHEEDRPRRRPGRRLRRARHGPEFPEPLQPAVNWSLMTNLFPLPYCAPALQRVPTPFRVLNEAFAFGERSLEGDRLIDRDTDGCPG